MVTAVRVTLTTAVVVISAIAAGFSAPALAAGGPSAAQVRRAVSRAESSNSLWATINICNSRRYRDTLGVRGQMPTLGFSTGLSMLIQVEYYSTDGKRFIVDRSPNARHAVDLGRWSTNLQQGGWAFPSFPAHSGLLDATVRFTWTRGGKVIGQTSRRTTAGHPDADYASPPHYSAAQCRIP